MAPRGVGLDGRRPVVTLRSRPALPMPRYAPPDAPDPFADGLPTLAVASGRVRLRQSRPSDLDAIAALFSDDEALRYWSHGAFESRAAAQTYLDGMAEGLADRSLFQWAIAEPEGDTLVGTVTVLGWDRRNRRAELGFILRPEWQGRGLATEAVTAVLDFAFAEMDLWRVEADADPANAGSLALLERLGFEREGLARQRWRTFGTWKDSVMLGLLRADWQARGG